MASYEDWFGLWNPFTSVAEWASYYIGSFGKGKTVGNGEWFESGIRFTINSVVGYHPAR